MSKRLKTKSASIRLVCSMCHQSFPSSRVHYNGCKGCNYDRPFFPRRYTCRPCFRDWINGAKEDNIGYRARQCWACHTSVGDDDLRRLLTKKQYEAYEATITKQCISAMNDVIHCPVPDCPNVFLKLDENHRCRVVQCDGCDTQLCGKCGEVYTPEHRRMKCDQYRKWKSENDADEKVMTKFLKRRRQKYQQCPHCDCSVEKREGCSSMVCLGCGKQFMWAP